MPELINNPTVSFCDSCSSRDNIQDCTESNCCGSTPSVFIQLFVLAVNVQNAAGVSPECLANAAPALSRGMDRGICRGPLPPRLCCADMGNTSQAHSQMLPRGRRWHCARGGTLVGGIQGLWLLRGDSRRGIWALL